MWCRVFGLKEPAPEPETIAEHVRRGDYVAAIQAESDEQGWFHLELSSSAGMYILDRYSSDEGIRDDLNTWAAWLEENAGAEAERLMQRMISTRQLITLRRDDRGDDPETRRFCHDLARWFAERTDGIYQIDGDGFFAADGRVLVAENDIP
jgi:hypothetical protein